ncbi:hypothetical protein M440DRAFT_143509 [Trichoderma longibrachiatum ATCC 18648]|uniref:Uncharacterized protein n=1 Tax=Trichoderma longibrachiatum ATCC 18648 TaxID=983965 RepID=A0A2T4BVA4_TRILO|nr:hypothetical protein M440DRAFT_143509 [Trichoderma longibrachiatum ATCC 18648]
MIPRVLLIRSYLRRSPPAHIRHYCSRDVRAPRIPRCCGKGMYSMELGMNIHDCNGNWTGWTYFVFSVFLMYHLSKSR